MSCHCSVRNLVSLMVHSKSSPDRRPSTRQSTLVVHAIFLWPAPSALMPVQNMSHPTSHDHECFSRHIVQQPVQKKSMLKPFERDGSTRKPRCATCSRKRTPRKPTPTDRLTALASPCLAWPSSWGGGLPAMLAHAREAGTREKTYSGECWAGHRPGRL